MDAHLLRLHRPDVADLSDWRAPIEPFSIMVQLMVGPANGRGEESFDVTLCSADWLKDRAASEGIVDTRSCHVVDGSDFDVARSYFARRVKACSGNDRSEVALKLSRIGRWEYEDYMP